MMLPIDSMCCDCVYRGSPFPEFIQASMSLVIIASQGNPAKKI